MRRHQDRVAAPHFDSSAPPRWCTLNITTQATDMIANQELSKRHGALFVPDTNSGPVHVSDDRCSDHKA
jgi:hypothetical protein